MVIAVYAAISGELRLPLGFSGPLKAYRAHSQVTSADLRPEASVWASVTLAARDDIFNITNGDQFRWQHRWPRIARMFDMETADPVLMPLSSLMTERAELWSGIVAKHGLLNTPYERVVSWNFADFSFNSGYDNVSSTIKARKAGLAECVETEEMFRTFFASLRAGKIIS
ncbi:hypothetical protein [Roseomonas sp. KE2513]|uniref:hypothetical protein n=1 Tax=Roseomonas sp. KE2513 TaxID=2479202 RepID=UPI0018DF8FD8|nr:hypothetical protein [Roseomonas sp. KE2513]